MLDGLSIKSDPELNNSNPFKMIDEGESSDSSVFSNESFGRREERKKCSDKGISIYSSES